jgi:nucleoside triphosphate diphosphatase
MPASPEEIASNSMQPSTDIARLIEIMAALRTPGSGCPWDLEQNFETIAPFTLEEAYEVVDAVQRGDLADLRDELGDLLLQVVFHARMAEEQKAFDFGGVVEAITAKMIRRHPHVFGEAKDLSPEAVKGLWAEIKAAEKAAKRAEKAAAPGSEPQAPSSLLADVAVTLPALTRAVKLQEKASRAGFDWKDAKLVVAKIREETDEVEAALNDGDADAIAEEIGDLFFAVANLARHRERDPETVVRAANAKFERRFGFIEAALAQRGQPFAQTSLAEMEALWVEAKAAERNKS